MVTNTVEQVALITGASKRIGAEIVQTLHRANINVIIHHHQSSTASETLVKHLNDIRPESACTFAADLTDLQAIKRLAQAARSQWGHLDILINNASAFYTTELESLDETHWEQLINLNMKAPLFLSCELAADLAERRGCIINITDIHADRPLKGHSVYSASKAGLTMITRSLAKELAPGVRCNAIAPGAILWPENDYDEKKNKMF